jgi:deoxyribonuclease-4
MIGTHIQKKKTFIKTLSDFYNASSGNLERPVQLFSGSPKGWKRNDPEEKDVALTREFIESNNLSVFVHSLYLINLCWSGQDFSKKALPCLQWEVSTGEKLGFKGVVVHCGKSCKLAIGSALDNMYTNLLTVLKHVDPKCPLLLETTSGQGTETCWQFDAFKQFYSRFTDDQRKRLKICIDTCHVFAAGHDPLKFIVDWEKEFPGSLALVHFNDSKGKCGCKTDRHMTPGLGEIGSEKMSLVADWCSTYKVPLLIE